jgi:hypothetical protein
MGGSSQRLSDAGGVQIYKETLLAITLTFGVMKANYNLKAVDYG